MKCRSVHESQGRRKKETWLLTRARRRLSTLAQLAVKTKRRNCGFNFFIKI